MGRAIHRLSARSITATSARGYYADGGGLYLQVSQAGNKSWVFRFTLHGRSREKGLGPLSIVSLAAARAKAAECRALVLAKVDPINHDASRGECPVFDTAARDYIEQNKAAWKNAKHAEQWTNTLTTYATPVIGNMLVRDITTAEIVRILSPIWQTKTETASRVRGRIETILDFAKVSGYRDGENPARWRGHLDKILPKRSKVAKVVHHPAMPYAEVPAFIRDLRKRNGVGAACLEFTILTAVRSREATGAVPAEFSSQAALWVIPEGRMKAGREHRVPLPARALEIAQAQPRMGPFVFPGPKGEEQSENAMLAVLKRMGKGDFTVHGFRSSFRDWAADQTDYPNEVVEMALAHTVKDKTEAAYRRGDLLDKRRALMADWAAYCESAAGVSE